MKKNKILTTALMVSALTIGSMVPVSAASVNGPTNTGTQVNIDVVESINDMAPNISVTVPTTLVLTVIANQEQANKDQAPIAMVPNVNDPSASGNQGEGKLKFVNASTKLVEENGKVSKKPATVYINGVTAEKMGSWGLVDTASTTDTNKALKVSIGENNATAQTRKVLKEDTMNDLGGITLAGPSINGADLTATPSYLSLAVEVNGKNEMYQKGTEANAFQLVWHIAGEKGNDSVTDNVAPAPTTR